MKKFIYLIICIFIGCELQAQGISFVEYKSWKDVLSLAREENKLIFLHAYADWSESSKAMETEVFIDELVGKQYNPAFINVKMDMEKGEGLLLSEQLKLQDYPTFYFINHEGKVVHQDVGSLSISDFIVLGQDARNPDKQFLTVQLKARAGRLSPKDFIDWAILAQRIKAPELDEVVKAYLDKISYSIMDKDILTIILYYAKYLTEKQLNELSKNKEKIIKIVELAEKDFEMIYLSKVTHFAYEKALQADSIDFATYHAVVSIYLPKDADKEVKRLKVNNQLYNETLGYEELIVMNDKDMLQAGGEYYYRMAETQKAREQKTHLNRSKQLYLKLSGFKDPERRTAYMYAIYINFKLNEIDPTNYFGMAERLKESISLKGKFMNEYPSDTTYSKTDQSHDYGALAFCQLFIRNYKEAIESAKKGLAIDPGNEEIYRDLAAAYLLSGQFDKAESIYLKFKHKIYPDNLRSFKDIFLQDLNDLEMEGIVSPSQPDIYNSVCRIRNLLNDKFGVH